MKTKNKAKRNSSSIILYIKSKKRLKLILKANKVK